MISKRSTSGDDILIFGSVSVSEVVLNYSN